MANISISSSTQRTQSDIRTIFINNIPKVFAYWHARFDPLWAVGASYVIGVQTEGAEDL